MQQIRVSERRIERTSFSPPYVAELLGAIGLILPSALRILPFLTSLAATGLAIIMVLATNEHISQGEPFLPTVVLFALAAFVAWGRYKMAPIQAK